MRLFLALALGACTFAADMKIVRAQIQLDRAHFSPGEIDGFYGENMRVALTGYQAERKLNVTGQLDDATIAALNADTAEPLVAYKLTRADVKGPFKKIPADMMAQAKLKKLGYASPAEALGEKFHISPKLLAELNPGKRLNKAGQRIKVPNIKRASLTRAERVVVTKDKRTVLAYGSHDKVLAQYPATIGSEHDPLPIGEWTVTVVQKNPVFNYNPDLFWDADRKHSKARIAAGPNNPVGVVWIGINKEHYGIHGTPEPHNIGHAESHGCIRLTNWDAQELSKMVRKGVPVSMVEGSATPPPAPTPAPETSPAAAPPAATSEMGLPIEGLTAKQLRDNFEEGRPGHKHEALDIMQPRGTPVHAVVDGTIAKLFESKAGGTTIYQFDDAGVYCYYYAHLDRYADGLKDGDRVKRGDVIGYVGSTGNASPDAPHLHFTMFRLTPEKKWWKGEATNPYPLLRQLVEK